MIMVAMWGLMWTGAAVAQSSTSGSGNPQQAGASVSEQPSNDLLTVTGCVTRLDMSYASGRQSVDGRAVTSGGDADRFALANARGPGDTTRGATTTGSSDAIAIGGPMYELLGQSADFRTHLGQRVEVRGRREPPQPGAAVGTAGAEKSAAAASTSPSASGNAPTALGSKEPTLTRLRVESIKMVSATCDIP